MNPSTPDKDVTKTIESTADCNTTKLPADSAADRSKFTGVCLILVGWLIYSTTKEGDHRIIPSLGGEPVDVKINEGLTENVE